jgi:hypothetical protein
METKKKQRRCGGQGNVPGTLDGIEVANVALARSPFASMG